MFSERYRNSKSPFCVIIETRVRPELFAEPKLGEVLAGQADDIVLQYTDSLRAVLFVIAYYDDPFGKREKG
jgi:hypothetical protein